MVHLLFYVKCNFLIEQLIEAWVGTEYVFKLGSYKWNDMVSLVSSNDNYFFI